MRNYELRHLTWQNKLARFLWQTVWLLLYRPTPVPLHAWRRFLLRCFGARVGKEAHPYPSAKIWAPWNLEMGDFSCLSHLVDCYSVDKVILEKYVTISQYSYLCTATHDYNQLDMPLITAPIYVRAYAWITADVFVGPGVTVGEGAVVGARSTVWKDIDSWTVVAGNPPKVIATRNQSAILGHG